jgi:hypothetical protein
MPTLTLALTLPLNLLLPPPPRGTVIFGFEQANKYSVYDQDGNVVALMAEEQAGLGNELGRQLLRTRRSFSMTVLSADGGLRWGPGWADGVLGMRHEAPGCGLTCAVCVAGMGLTARLGHVVACVICQ